MRFVLGSESKWRKQLFAEMGYDFDVMPANIDEKKILDNRPDVRALLIAVAKSRALWPKLNGDYLLVTGDQVVEVNKRIRGKPETHAEAHLFLETAHLHPATTHSAIVVYHARKRTLFADVDTATIHFKKISEAAIEALIDEGDALLCAGGFACESRAIQPFIARIEGVMDSIQGFPKKMVAELIGAALS